MANYANLKSAIQQVIKTNGNNEITGALLQQSLLAIITSLGGYYQFAGIATPSTNPGTPDQNVFYIGGAGTYSNFSSLVIPTGYIGVLKYNGTWTLETVQAGDVNTVKFVAQTLTDNQKTQARTNIEAASNEQVSQLEAKVGGKYESSWNGNSQHSATANRVVVNIPSGKEFKIKLVGTSGQAYYFANIGETGNIGGKWCVDGTEYTITAPGNIAEIGVYHAAIGQDKTVTITVEVGEVYTSIKALDTQVQTLNAEVSALDGEVENIGTKVKNNNVEIKGLSPFYNGSGVSQVGDAFYHTADKKIYRCTVWSGTPSTSTYEVVPFLDGAIYPCNDSIYVWDGQNLVLLDNSVQESTDDLESAVFTYENGNTLTPDGTLVDAYIGGNGTIGQVGNNSFKIDYYKVSRGDVVRIKKDAFKLSGSFPCCGFTVGVPTVNSVCDVLYSATATATDFSELWKAGMDGYLLCAYSPVSPSALDVFTTTKQSKIEELEESVSETLEGFREDIFEVIDLPKLTPDGTLIDAYIAENGLIGSVSSNSYTVSYYAVESGKTYHIKKDAFKLNGSYPCVSFSASIPAAGSSTTVLYSATNVATDFDEYYTPTSNGYLVTAQVSIALDVFQSVEVNRIDELEEEIGGIGGLDSIEASCFPLKGKSIAVLGDSIMMLMRTNYSGTNTVSYKDANSNTYEFAELTNIGGLLYVTSSLVNGQVTGESIQVFVHNSNQAKFDEQNWSALKDGTKAVELINCGLGGATLFEREITTDSPAPDNDKMTDVPNECRWLKKQVDGGRVSPNCIMVWAGTNGILTSEPNNFDTIMGVDWSVLSADTQVGKQYRQTFYGGLRFILEFLYREFPTATVMVFSPIQSGVSIRNYSNIELTGGCIKKMANRYSAIFVDSMKEMGIVDLFEEAISGTDRWLSDGLHPNTAGKLLYANYTTNVLNRLFFSKIGPN